MSTTISGTLVDQQGQVWSLASVQFRLQKAAESNTFYTVNDAPFNTTPAPVITDAAGSFTIVLPASNEIVPDTSSWLCTITPNASSPAVNLMLRTITGSLNISSLFNSIAKIRTVQSKYVPRAYNDSEVAIPPNVGQLYYNVIAKTLKYFENNIWNPIGQGGGSMVYPPPGIPVSDGSSWAASINPASLITYPPAGLANSSGTGWTTPIDPATLQRNISLTTNGNSGPASFSGNVLNIPQYAGAVGGMVYPGVGVAASTGSAWAASIPTVNFAFVNNANVFTPLQTMNNGLTVIGQISGSTEILDTILTLGHAHLRLGNRSAGAPVWGTGSANINADVDNVIFNGTNGGIFFNYDMGTGGIYSCDGAGTITGRIDAGGNATFNGTMTAQLDVIANRNMHVSGAFDVSGRAAIGSGAVIIGNRNTIPWSGIAANINADNQSFVINAPTGAGKIYFNYDQGTNGIAICNGSGGSLLTVDSNATASLPPIHCFSNIIADGALQAGGSTGPRLFWDGGSSFLEGAPSGRLLINQQSGPSSYLGITGTVQVLGSLTVNTNAQVNGNINTGSFQINSTAPLGQVLTGDGTHYVPQPPLAYQFGLVANGNGRAFGTIYQNTSGKPMFLSGSGRTNGSSIGSMRVVIGPDVNSVSIVVFIQTSGSTVNNGSIGFFGAIPSGWFYRVDANTNTNNQGFAVTAPDSWVETT